MKTASTYFYRKQLVNALEYIGIIILLFFRRNIYSVLAYMIIGLLVILFSQRKYFPYLSYLRVNAASVERCVLGYPIVKLSRDGMFYTSCKIRNVEFAVFSKKNVDYCSLDGMLYLVRKKQAIIYPFTGTMKTDLAIEFHFDANDLELSRDAYSDSDDLNGEKEQTCQTQTKYQN